MITNNSNLPEALVAALKNDTYDKGDCDYSITGLLKPPRIVALEKRHEHEIEEDAEDGLYRLYGTLAHLAVERSNMSELALAEKRFFAKFGSHKISGMIDTLCLIKGTLSDYKFTTAWGFKKDSEPKPEWVAQLNMQLELLRQNGLDASKLQIVGLLRDYQLRSAKEDPNYPQSPVVVLDIPMWSREQTVAFINMRIAAHVEASNRMPECSRDERWAKPDTWAVIKNGQKRAINGGVQLSEELAQAVCAKNPGTRVDYRPGASVRCADYCAVSKFCTQYQKEINKTQTESEEAIA